MTYMDWPRGYNFFSCSTQLSMTFQTLINSKILIKKFLALRLSDGVFIMLINVKMPTIEYENSLITSGPDYLIAHFEYLVLK